MMYSREKALAFPWVVALLGLGLRVSNLGGIPLWADEAFTWYWSHQLAQGDWDWLWTIDFNPPLYYLAQVPAHHLVWWGISPEIAARIPSLLFEMGFVWWAWRGIRAARIPHGTLWIALWALSPAAIEGARTGRGYTLFLWLSAIAWTSLSTTLQERSLKSRGWLWVGLTGAIYTHYYGFFLMGAMALRILFSTKKGRFKHLLVLLGPPLLAFLPWLPHLLTQMGRGNEMIQRLSLSRIPRGFASLFTGQVLFLESKGVGAWELAVLLFGGGMGLWLAFRGMRALGKAGQSMGWEAIALPTFALGMSLLGLNVWEEYWFLAGLPALLWLVVGGLNTLPQPTQRPAGLLLVVWIALQSLHIPHYVHQDWGIAAERTSQASKMGIPVIANIPFDVEPLVVAMDWDIPPRMRVENVRQERDEIARLPGTRDKLTTYCRYLPPHLEGDLYLVGSFDPLPKGGLLEGFDACPHLSLVEEWLGRRVFVRKYTAVR